MVMANVVSGLAVIIRRSRSGALPCSLPVFQHGILATREPMLANVLLRQAGPRRAVPLQGKSLASNFPWHRHTCRQPLATCTAALTASDDLRVDSGATCQPWRSFMSSHDLSSSQGGLSLGDGVGMSTAGAEQPPESPPPMTDADVKMGGTGICAVDYSRLDSITCLSYTVKQRLIKVHHSISPLLLALSLLPPVVGCMVPCCRLVHAALVGGGCSLRTPIVG